MENIGKYEVIEKIGAGGFGVVYKGYDPFIKRPVAIKTCTSDDEETRQRFFRETEIAGNLHHRNIVTVYDFGIQDQIPYLVQEYLSGEDLDHKIRRGEYLAYPEKLLYLVQIARGLEYAHSKSVVHRDIKPANIRILEDGTAKIMDFGIAKLMQRETRLTQTGMTLGTAAYLAPEQIRGEAIDNRTDIFSYGVLIYELLTYRRPFKGKHLSTILNQILNDPPTPIFEYWPDCPPEMARIIERCLEKQREARFTDVSEILDQLDALLSRGRPSAALIDTRASTFRLEPGAPSPPGEPPRQASGGAGPGPGLADFEFPDDQRRTPPTFRATAVYRRRGLPPWSVPAVALLLAAGAVVWLWLRGDLPSLLTTPGAGAAEEAEAAVAAGDPGPAPGGPLAGSAAGAGGQGAAGSEPSAGSGTGAPAGAAEPASSPPEAPPALEEAEEVPAPEPPKEPERATLILPAAWDGRMTATINGGITIPLDRERSRRLAPGRYVLTFSLLTPDYSATREIQLRLDEGERRRVPAPIEPPGRLTVQARIGSPQGLVRVDGELIGQSRIAGALLGPGIHQLEVAPLPGTAGSPVAAEIQIASQQETIVTFDLTGRRELVVRRPAGSS